MPASSLTTLPHSLCWVLQHSGLRMLPTRRSRADRECMLDTIAWQLPCNLTRVFRGLQSIADFLLFVSEGVET